MALTALLISEQRVKQYTNLDDNVRVTEITPFIIQSQDLYLQPRLGTKFFTRLKNGVINGDLNADEKELLNDYISPMLAHYSVYLMLPGLKYKLVDKGVVSGTSEETQPTTLQELEYLRQATLDTAEFYDQRLREYLRDVTSGTFPQYSQPGTDGMQPDYEPAYFSGLVIPNYTKLKYDKNCGCYSDCDCIGGVPLN
jgi:hypothetical protein